MLDLGAVSSKVRAQEILMSNRAIWNVRKRHEWLATPLKAKRVKRAARLRCGLQDAMDRKAGIVPASDNS